MPGFPQNVQEVGTLIDLGVFKLTVAAVPVSVRSRRTMGVSIQAEPDNAVDVLIGDRRKQTRRLAARDVYSINAGDPREVYMRAASGTASANVHIIQPPGARRS